MMIVEHKLPGFQWAEPMQGDRFKVEPVGSGWEITGKRLVFPEGKVAYALETQFERFASQFGFNPEATERVSPGVEFANADTDEKLVDFVTKFGPVIATSILHRVDQVHDHIFLLAATQDMQELRDEHTIYRSALTLMDQTTRENPDDHAIAKSVKIISEKIKAWPRQWEREKSSRHQDPLWKPTLEANDGIEAFSGLRSFNLDPIAIGGRFILCALLNSFRPIIFPNALQLNSYLEFGIRPLLYSILRHQFAHPRHIAICRSPGCRKFFSIIRAGQTYCGPDCSRVHRQRLYWQETGAAHRERRNAQRKTQTQLRLRKPKI